MMYSSLLFTTSSYLSEKMIFGRCQIRRMQWLLKNLPFELLDCCFDDLGNRGPGAVVENDGLALSIKSFQPNNVIYKVKLGNVELFVHSGICQSHQKQIMAFFE